MPEEEKITLEKFEALCIQLFAQRKLTDDANDEYKEQSAVLEVLKSKVLAFLEENNKDKYSVKGHGLISTVDRFTVQVPKTLEDKQAFFDHLKERGIFLEMASINSQTLNSFYKTEMESAVAQGNVDFSLPGIGEPKHVKTLSMRKES